MKQPTRRDLQAEARQNQLLDRALALFAERGVENVSIKDLAAEVDVAQGLIYYYFQSKDELLTAVMKRHNPLPQVQSLIEQLSDLPAHDGLLLFAQRVAALLPEKRLILRLLARELLSPRSNLLAQALPLRDEAMTQLAQYLQRRIAAGELRPHHPLITIHLLISSLLTLLLLEQPLEPVVPQLVETIFAGIRAI